MRREQINRRWYRRANRLIDGNYCPDEPKRQLPTASPKKSSQLRHGANDARTASGPPLDQLRPRPKYSTTRQRLTGIKAAAVESGTAWNSIKQLPAEFFFFPRHFELPVEGTRLP